MAGAWENEPRGQVTEVRVATGWLRGVEACTTALSPNPCPMAVEQRVSWRTSTVMSLPSEEVSSSLRCQETFKLTVSGSLHVWGHFTDAFLFIFHLFIDLLCGFLLINI